MIDQFTVISNFGQFLLKTIYDSLGSFEEVVHNKQILLCFVRSHQVIIKVTSRLFHERSHFQTDLILIIDYLLGVVKNPGISWSHFVLHSSELALNLIASLDVTLAPVNQRLIHSLLHPLVVLDSIFNVSEAMHNIR